jgi:hypothetical protein
MFQVDKIENAFLLTHFDQQAGETVTTSFKDEKALVTGIRNLLGLKAPGRPKKVKVFDPFENESAEV